MSHASAGLIFFSFFPTGMSSSCGLCNCWGWEQDKHSPCHQSLCSSGGSLWKQFLPILRIPWLQGCYSKNFRLLCFFFFFFELLEPLIMLLYHVSLHGGVLIWNLNHNMPQNNFFPTCIALKWTKFLVKAALITKTVYPLFSVLNSKTAKLLMFCVLTEETLVMIDAWKCRVFKTDIWEYSFLLENKLAKPTCGIGIGDDNGV